MQFLAGEGNMEARWIGALFNHRVRGWRPFTA